METPRNPDEILPDVTTDKIEQAMACIVADAIGLPDVRGQRLFSRVGAPDIFEPQDPQESSIPTDDEESGTTRPKLRLVTSDTVAPRALREVARNRQAEVERRRNEAECALIDKLREALDGDEVSHDPALDVDRLVLERLAALSGQQYPMLDVARQSIDLSTGEDDDSEVASSLKPALLHIRAMSRCIYIVAGGQESDDWRKEANAKYINQIAGLSEVVKQELIKRLWNLPPPIDMASWKSRRSDRPTS
jgi:hypothetical protein